ncbi:MAG: response regulator transcription factor [Polyangiaceae bacterium]|nr:response regulator transcription factor [Polyangiaceae bacterium]
MNVLIVEDDLQLVDLLERVFRDFNHVPTVCGTLKAAEEKLANRSFDIVLLDWMLPDGDGIDLCARLRNRVPPVPVLMLTARGELSDRVSGLRAGADDYITKPFEIEELLARVEAVCRRANQDWLTHIGALEIDRRSQFVRADGKRLDLTPREYMLLTRLADCPGACVTRPTLLADVWNMSFDPGSGIIDVQVSRLRDKLGEHAWMVDTVRGHGFRLRTSR